MFGNISRNSKPSSTAETLEGKKLRVVIVEVKKPLIKTVITRLTMGTKNEKYNTANSNAKGLGGVLTCKSLSRGMFSKML